MAKDFGVSTFCYILMTIIFRGEIRIFDMVYPDFSESCGYMQYLFEYRYCIAH